MVRDDGYTSPETTAACALRYLERRVREEAEAAVRASSTEATLLHIALATAYARRFGETSARSSSSGLANASADECRIW